MDVKIISPDEHGLIDYSFAAILLGVPALLSMGKKSKFFYNLLGINVILFSSLTRYKYHLLPVIPLTAHRVLDIATVTVIAGNAFSGQKKKRKINLLFSSLLVTTGVLAICITDWNRRAVTR